ncbi:MAG TPA: hypothetical protein PKH07_19985, partial [bacterium]|nr:hypothetical protein [bacterium]
WVQVEVATQSGQTYTAREHFTVLSVDLAVDSDNNGIIEPADDAVETLNPGNLICVNRDDDNINDLQDRDEDEDFVYGEDELSPVILTWQGPRVGVIRLSLLDTEMSERSAVYTNSFKGDINRLDLPVEWNLRNCTPPGVLYIEGVDRVRNDLHVAWKVDNQTICEDVIRFTVFDMNIAMDGNRDGTIDFNNPEDDKYVFWVNDDRDVRYHDESPDYMCWVEDDLQGGTSDCDDDRIGTDTSPFVRGCRRDLEDFTRVHLFVDDVAVSCENLNFYLRFKRGTPSPTVNLFSAVDGGSTRYLTNPEKADEQKEETRLLTVTSSEIQLPSGYPKTGGAPFHFILEGKSPGKGQFCLIAKAGEDHRAEAIVDL